MEVALNRLGLLDLEGYRFARPLLGGQMAQVGVYRRGPGPVTLVEPAPDEVVVKFLIAPRRDREVEAFRREAETLLMLRRLARSPTIVKALTNVKSLEPLPVHYFFMEYVEGPTLRELFAETPLPWPVDRALDVLRRIALALVPAAASAQVHRDLHPGNILLLADAGRTATASLSPHALIDEDPGVRILDFGVGHNWVADQRDRWQEDRFRHPGAISSWSPELLADPSHVDSKHDVWALGNLFYRMVTGEYAFFADNFRDYYSLVSAGSYDRELLVDLPVHVQRLIACMFEVAPNKRLSLGGVLKIATDAGRGLIDWLARHPMLAELYFLVEGNIWTCPLCSHTGNPDMDSRCRSCGRYVAEFLLPFDWQDPAVAR